MAEKMAEKKTVKHKRNKTISIHLTAGELIAALVACENYNGPLKRHPKLQTAVAARLRKEFLVSELYK